MLTKIKLTLEKTGGICNKLYFLFIILFAICGLLIFFFGVWLKITLSEFSQVSKQLAFEFPLAVIFVGLFIVVKSVLGLLCVTKPHFLFFYGFCLLFFFAIELFICLCFYFYTPNVNEKLAQVLRNGINNYSFDNEGCNIMDSIQLKFQCCGVEGPKEWLAIERFERIPQSCCRKMPCDTTDRCEVQAEGCRRKVKCYMYNKKKMLEFFLFLSALLPFIGTLIAFCLATILTRHQYERVE